MSIRSDRLSLLDTFVRVAERGSLSAAARDLDVSQPSVSRQLAALEARLGVVLMRRTTHDVTLTPDGHDLLSDARRLIAEWEAIEERTAQDGALAGRVRVVAPLALGQSLLVNAAARFMKRHPDITIDWRLRDDPIRVAEEGCDCWLKVGPVPDDTLVVRELARVERLVVATPACLTDCAETDLSALPWVTLGPFEGNRIELFNRDGAATAFSVLPRLASDNIFAVQQAVRQGVGVAILPRWFVASALDNGTLIDVAPKWRAAELPVNLALAAGTRRPARVDRFADFIAEWCAERLGRPQ